MTKISDLDAMKMGIELEFCTRAVMLAAAEGEKLMDHTDEQVGSLASILAAGRTDAHRHGLRAVQDWSASEDQKAVLAWGPAYKLVRSILREAQHAPGFFKGRALRAEAERIIGMIEALRIQAKADIAALPDNPKF